MIRLITNAQILNPGIETNLPLVTFGIHTPQICTFETECIFRVLEAVSRYFKFVFRVTWIGTVFDDVCLEIRFS